MSGTGKARSERWRERRRKGLIALTINVSPAHRRAFERMGLLAPGSHEDRDALTWAVERFLDTAPAVQAIGDALYRDADDFTESGEAEDETVSPGNTGENAGHP